VPTYDYKCSKCGTIEIFHGIHDEPVKVCPYCQASGLERLIGSGGAVIMAGKEMNQYNDVQLAKYWRDRKGQRHKVEPGDGHSKS
jgi:putative FmdB family regulatory protein